ncbi:MAG UNVERIFIED_CONTAM: phosphate ABC transporter, permease protein PstA, partial [Thermobifida fusca]
MSATKLSAPEKTVPPRPLAPSLGAKPLPALFPPTLLAGVALVAAGLLYALGWWNPAVWAIVTAVGYMVLITAASALVEN